MKIFGLPAAAPAASTSATPAWVCQPISDETPPTIVYTEKNREKASVGGFGPKGAYIPTRSHSSPFPSITPATKLTWTRSSTSCSPAVATGPKLILATRTTARTAAHRFIRLPPVGGTVTDEPGGCEENRVSGRGDEAGKLHRMHAGVFQAGRGDGLTGIGRGTSLMDSQASRHSQSEVG